MSKATIYLDDTVHDALRVRAAETGRSMSDLVNDALNALKEDLEEHSDWKTRREEKTVSYEQPLSQLQADGYNLE